MADTLFEMLCSTVERFPDKPYIHVPASESRDWLKEGAEFTYAAVAEQVERLRRAYAEAGYGHGHRVMLSVETRPEHFFHLLALNALGVSVVPGNPGHRADEMAFQMRHSEVEFAIVAQRLRPVADEAARRSALEGWPVRVIELGEAFPPARRPAPRSGKPGPQTEAVLLYTSGTTGTPKGSMTSNRYAVVAAEGFLNAGGLMDFGQGCERVYNPLPVFHLNMGLHTPTWSMMSGNCMILPDRFSPKRFWREIADSGATVMAFMGIIPPLMLSLEPGPDEHRQVCRLGFGPGVAPEIRTGFEARFGIKLIDAWGMTEVARAIRNNVEPRDFTPGAIGRPARGLEVRIVDDDDHDVRKGEAGELVLRASGGDPRDGFTSGYLKEPEATEQAWRGGWFHTGDLVRQSPEGAFYFVDRKKNIIRRSGENISGAEVEAALMTHPGVSMAAVIAVEDELRQEECMACIVLNADLQPTEAMARDIFGYVTERLSYFKAPGWILFRDELPVTQTQKIQKHRLFSPGVDPRSLQGAIDLRALKVSR
jgi:acyl-CoA synthetase (AMP-forming)/AMP-acid ligase II